MTILNPVNFGRQIADSFFFQKGKRRNLSYWRTQLIYNIEASFVKMPSKPVFTRVSGISLSDIFDRSFGQICPFTPKKWRERKNI